MNVTSNAKLVASQINEPVVATKIQRRIRWRWWDWAIFIVFAGIVVISAVRPWDLDWWIRLLILVALGIAVVAAYHFTVHQLWVRLLPGLYRQWVCSRCRRPVKRKDVRCPRCGAEFH